jgi:hypothetical protein
MFILASKQTQQSIHVSLGVEPELNRRIGVNVHKTTFRIIPQPFVIPKVPVSGLDIDHRNALASLYATIVPDYIQGCSLLEKSSVGMTPHVIEWVRPLTEDKETLLYVIRIAGNYLGGALDSEVKERGRSTWYASFETDRIYYESYLLPVTRITQKGQEAFDPISVFDHTTYEKDDSPGYRFISYGIFSEVDMSEQNTELSRSLDPQQIYRLHKVFPLLCYFHRTPAFHIADPIPQNYEQIAEFASPILHLLTEMRENFQYNQIDPPNQKKLNNFLKSMKWQESFTRSGLRCWVKL